MKFYEIVRFSDQWPEMEEFETVKKMIDRGWFHKAVAFMSDWDYGGENIDVARSYDKLWDSPTDPQEPGDKVLYQSGDRYICQSTCSSGLYTALYLVGVVSEAEL